MKAKNIIQGAVRAAAALFVVMTLAAGCSLFMSEDEKRIKIVNKELSLVAIDDAESYSTDSIEKAKAIGSRAPAKPEVPGGATITLLAEVDPPKTAEGKELQASHIFLDPEGKTAYVSYMLRGEEVAGGLDVFDVSKPDKPVLLFSQLFDSKTTAFDIAVVQADANTVYLGGQQPDQSGEGKHAFLMAVPLKSKNNGVDTSKAVSTRLPGHFVTDLYLTQSALYVTTGAYTPAQPNVGLYVLDPATLAVKASKTDSYPDLRSVALSSSNVAVFEANWTDPATEALVDIYRNGDLNDATKRAQIQLDDYKPDAEAKSRMAWYKDTILVAANHSGVVLINAKDAGNPSIRGSIPAPSLNPSLVEVENQSSNAVSSGYTGKKNLIYIANGEAGLWVGDADAIESQNNKSTAAVAGSIRFGADESVNYVASKNELVICASGLGGLKILSIKAK